MDKKPKKILITSYYFPPLLTPRSFRTYELAKEFSKRDYEVEVFIPGSSNSRNIELLPNCNIREVSSNSNENDNSKKKIRNFELLNSRVLFSIKKTIRYLVGDDPRSLIYCYRLYKELMKSGNKKYDLIISIGLPFYIHLATAKFIDETNQKCVSVCDYGDPFYKNPATKKIFVLKYLEKKVINIFDYISIPTKKSLNYYTDFKNERYIKVIPQGFDFSIIKTQEYYKNNIPTFGYAGIFYEKIRDPKFFFEYLSQLKTEFCFIIYTHKNDIFFRDLYNNIPMSLRKKIVVKDFIPREQLIKELSKLDFLINFENEYSNQVPSKLIDYSLSKRPIISLNKNQFNKSKFESFLKGDYKNATNINLAQYDIKNVVNEFEKLINN